MKNILVLYGGMSPEHEVSIITALQVMNALSDAGYTVHPGYITKQGDWYLENDSFFKPDSYINQKKLLSNAKLLFPPTSPNQPFLTKSLLGYKKLDLKIDAIFPIFHGKNGEDGSIQGLVQLLNIPQVGCQVTASAIGMDKYLTKRIAVDLGIKTNPDVLVTKSEWLSHKNAVINKIKRLGSDLFLKPNTLGSSIGIQRITDLSKLIDALDVAFAYDQRVLVEKTLSDATEVNISILGNDPFELSTTEQPLGSEELLSFQDKYLSSDSQKTPQGMASAQRIMPATVSKFLISKIEKDALDIFRAIDGRGIARLDFMVKGNDIYFNEINTIPGSLSFYLWEKSGVKFPQLVTKLVKLAIEDWQAKQKLVTTFESNILKSYNSNSAKGAKTS